ncbi:ATP-grasp fold amidoligase family protein [Autumnicola musiva]|uniref:ATP-grasp fold amidoligase family protein n=1 Tax=Autumnicola musiva TaxID=3075589 RepID=A0ABU3D7X1_9FLAO|nr:ATP-grasp fold amidoligase family protein [Zunongwangia sp. F117]MDT0677464.1 ATP-grasp fold amidoligase family protein [Zunongwangia sp. F117]
MFSSKFTRRIHERIDAFYRDSEVRKTLVRKLYASDDISVWKDSKRWQFQLNNKHNSREFAQKFNCKVPDLYWEGRKVEKINFGNLPEKYVIRPTIGYSANMVFLMQGDKNLFDDREYSEADIVKELSFAVKENPELDFLVEEFVSNENGQYPIPDDYKIYSFNGEIACIQVINRTGRKKGTTSFYDENWNQLERVQQEYLDGDAQPAPACLQEMIQEAKRLSKAYEIFARIDFYATQKGAVFGEFTPTPFRGNGFTPFGRKLLINYWDKYCPGMI